MPAREDAYARHQQKRWMRQDAQRWIRPDAARFLKPDTDLASVYPALELKYNPSQPRVPAGNGRESGRWTDGNSGGTDGGTASPTGNIDFGGLPNFSDVFSLFQISPSETDNTDYTQLAGDVSQDRGPELPSSEPPEIPQQMPKTSAERTGVMRAAANWLARNSGLAGEIYVGAMNNIG